MHVPPPELSGIDGCTCTVIHNGWLTRVSNHGCPFHGTPPTPRTAAVTPPSDSRTHDGECDRAQPARLSGGAH